MPENNGRIEISMNEYNSLKEQIEILNKSLVQANKKVDGYEEKIARLADTFVDLYGSTVQARLFKWNNICNPMFEEFNRSI